MFSLLKSQTHCTLCALHWNALPYIGKFDGQAAFGIYGLAATYGYGCSTVTVNLRLRPLYGCGQSMVMANLRLQPIYGYGQSTVAVNLRWLLLTLCPLQLQFCYI